MPEQKQYIQSYLDGILERVPSARAVLVTDAEGIVLLKSFAAEAYQENSVDVTLAAVYAGCTVQASKLQFGKNKSIVSWQKDRMLFHLNASPFYVTVVCNKDGNVGLLSQVAPQLIKVLEPLNEIDN